VPSVAEIRDQALQVASGWSPPDAPASWQLTAALLRAIAEHDELLDRLTDLPPDRLPALLASAATTFLVRRDRPVPLAGYFPVPGGAQPGFDDGFYPAAREFLRARAGDIAAVCGQHRYQMDEVARSAQIACGVAATAPATEPVALVDLGTRAGLGLQLDRYRFVVGEIASGPADGLTLGCDVRGSHQPPPVKLPPISSRAGIESHPVDLEDAAARAWLESCAPPEASALARLATAIEVTRKHPVHLVAGDVIDTLPGVLESFPPGQHVIVTDTYFAVSLSGERRERLIGILAAAARTGPVTWLSLDPLVPLGPSGRDSVQGLPVPESLVTDYQRDGVFAVLGARTFSPGATGGRLLARAHPSGAWIEWLDTSSPR
jgi:hypothetical protein